MIHSATRLQRRESTYIYRNHVIEFNSEFPDASLYNSWAIYFCESKRDSEGYPSKNENCHYHDDPYGYFLDNTKTLREAKAIIDSHQTK